MATIKHLGAGSQRGRIKLGLLSWLLISLTAPVLAETWHDKLDIHGYGSAIYGETDGNTYLTGSEDGDFDNLNFALNLTARLGEKTRLNAQIDFSKTPFSEDEIEVELDFLFGAWSVNDDLELRFGRVKQPFGIYTEIFDVGTVRPFLLLPQGLYGPQAIVSQHYEGIGVSGRRITGAWGIEYDVYVGQLETELAASLAQILGIAAEFPIDLTSGLDFNFEFEIRDLIGGRFTVMPPVRGLDFGFSAYRGKAQQPAEQPIPVPGLGLDDVETFGVHLEYLDDHWSIRGEYIDFNASMVLEQETFYVEVARHLTEKWQVAARYDDWEGRLPFIPDAFVPPLLRQSLVHEDLGLALNYWVSTGFVLKLNYHRVEGNRLAFPTEPERIFELLGGAPLDERTDLIQFGIQLGF